MKPPEGCASIEEVREGIDALDREVIALIGDRARFVEAAARFKTGESSVRAPEHRKAMLQARRRWAEEEGLRPQMIEDVYESLISYFVNRELERWRETPS